MSERNRSLTKVLVLAGGSLLAVAAVTGVAHSAGHMGQHTGMHHGFGGGKFFEVVDTNHDGTITQAEIAAFTNSRVKEFDTNRDGQITRQEFDAERKTKQEERQQARFKKIDANGDGVISADEFKNARQDRGSKHHNEKDGA